MYVFLYIHILLSIYTYIDTNGAPLPHLRTESARNRAPRRRRMALRMALRVALRMALQKALRKALQKEAKTKINNASERDTPNDHDHVE